MNRITIDGVEYRVRFRHCHIQGLDPLRSPEDEGDLHRRWELIDDAFNTALSMGQVDFHALSPSVPPLDGVTVCTIEDNQVRRVLATGYAFCSSRDQFNKAKGRKIALDRARHDLSQRKTICDALEMDL